YEKLGARIDSTSIGRHAEINSPARKYNPEELGKLQEQLQAFYDQFVEKAADSRHSTPEKIDALAQGRVWTGRQAKQNKLVDELKPVEGRDRSAAGNPRAAVAVPARRDTRAHAFYVLTLRGLGTGVPKSLVPSPHFLPDRFLKAFAIDVDLHLLLGLDHVGRE